LLDEALYERAQELLSGGASSAQVAEELGYAELSSFYRAFRRWSDGRTPRGRPR
jgi:AraC-like DNA-binding protein